MFSWFFSTSTPTEQDGLKVLDHLRYTSDVEFFMKTLKSAVSIWPGIHVAFLPQFANGELLESSVEMLKAMMAEWPEDLAVPMAGLLNANSIVAAKAMGSEKSKFNTLYYTPVRNALKMTAEDFRKFLVTTRKGWDVVLRTCETTKPYCLCLFNEPLMFNITNIKCNEDIPIITMYKGEIKRHPYMYDPVETPLETPLTQKDIYTLQKEAKTKEPIVIIASNIGENVYLPNNVWVVFTNSTKSWGDRVIPFFHEKGHSVLTNMIDFLQE